MRWQGFALGILALTMLDVVVRSKGNAQRASGIFAGASKVASKFMDPTQPLLSPIAGTSTSSSSSSSQAAPQAAANPSNTAPLPAGVIAV